MHDDLNSPQLARHPELTAIHQAHVIQLPNLALQSAWEKALIAVLRADHPTTHAYALGYALGMAGGWTAAELFDLTNYNALCALPALDAEFKPGWGQA